MSNRSPIAGWLIRRLAKALKSANRKAMEEVGITLKNPRYLGSYFHTRQYKKDAICVAANQNQKMTTLVTVRRETNNNRFTS